MINWSTPWQQATDGQIIDFGYGEFICTPTTAQHLIDGGMTHVNGQRVTLEIVDRLPASNAVVVKFFSADGDNLNTEWARYWAEQKTGREVNASG